MEDILASIRKMISEERLGPRPIPDQIGRSSFGESAAETPAAASPSAEPRVERGAAPTERQPSYSSLSEALKAATPAPEQRRTLEEKIADILEGGDPASRPAAPPDPLAVFAANRPAPATAPDSGPFGQSSRNGAPERSTVDRPAAERTNPRPSLDAGQRTPRPASRSPEAPPNGSGYRREDGGLRSGAAPTSPKAPAPSSVTDSKKPDTQRIIAMPTRHGVSSAAVQPPSPASPAPNGANVSSLGPRPASGAQGYRPASALREGDAAADKSADAQSGSSTTTARANETVTAKSSDSLTVGPTKVAREAQPERAEAGKAHPVDILRPLGVATSAPAPAIFDTAVTAKTPSDDESAKTTAEQAAATVSGAPSDALVDAVVALVHKEPDTLSVFTSGSAFIHGVNSRDQSRPGPNVARKLDRSAAELLRPMLRQWLAENMPRIVEEALRSELLNTQDAPKDSSNET
jgi:cell pole-organizing protein PopZ